VVKNMLEQKICQNCSQRVSCSRIYRQLGSSKVPSVLLKTICAFLLPLVVFTVSVTVFENILADKWRQREFALIVSVLIALIITCGFMVFLKILSRKFAKNKKFCKRSPDFG